MKFFDHIFDVQDTSDYNVSGLGKELSCINIYDAFIRNNKGILVVTSSTYVANLLYQTLLNYTDKVLFFPMDDFLTSEAIAISPEFLSYRLDTLNRVIEENYIVITNLMGYLRFLPNRDTYKNSIIDIKTGDTYNMQDLINKLYSLGYERERRLVSLMLILS